MICFHIKIKGTLNRNVQCSFKDAARLSPCKDDNEVLRKIDRKDCLFFI